MSPAAAGAAPMQREVTISRLIAAPRDLVFKTWTDPAHLARWWGPRGFSNPVCEVDARVGGELRIVMRGPDGTDYPMRGVFREVVAPQRLVFTNFPVDADDRPLLDGHTTVTFADEGGKTRLTVVMRATALAPVAARMLEGMETGWTQSIDRLEAYAAGLA
jgi:uncharacterized protein YndB with AHSA1/START domain